MRENAVIVGAGQAGLSVSRELSERGVEHVVLERGRAGETWRRRWDSFCLVTPNWGCRLPGWHYSGGEPDGYMARDEIVEYLEGYAASTRAPVRSGIAVTGLAPSEDGMRLDTSDGPIETRCVVLSTGAYQKPYRPSSAATLPAAIPQIDVERYRNPSSLPEGKVLIVGSGQSGCQVAEELTEAGREVFLACGRTPWVNRRYGDRDFFSWAVETGFLDAPLSSLPNAGARVAANLVATGHGGGHDLHLRTLRQKGVALLGHFLGADGWRARFADDLAASVAWGDDRYRDFAEKIEKLVAERGLEKVEIPPPTPFDVEAPQTLDLRGFGAVIFCGGFRPDYGSWVNAPSAFDGMDFPITDQGASTAVPGLYFVGVHFLRKRQSSLLFGVGEDAAIVAERIARAGRQP